MSYTRPTDRWHVLEIEFRATNQIWPMKSAARTYFSQELKTWNPFCTTQIQSSFIQPGYHLGMLMLVIETLLQTSRLHVRIRAVDVLCLSAKHVVSSNKSHVWWKHQLSLRLQWSLGAFHIEHSYIKGGMLHNLSIVLHRELRLNFMKLWSQKENLKDPSFNQPLVAVWYRLMVSRTRHVFRGCSMCLQR